NYDPNKLNTNGKPYKFTSYLSASVVGEIRRTLRDVYLGAGMKIPRKVSESYVKIVKADSDFSDSVENLSKRTGVEPELVEEVLKFMNIRNYQSLDKVVIDNDDSKEDNTVEEQIVLEADYSSVEGDEFISYF